MRKQKPFFPDRYVGDYEVILPNNKVAIRRKRQFNHLRESKIEELNISHIPDREGNQAQDTWVSESQDAYAYYVDHPPKKEEIWIRNYDAIDPHRKLGSTIVGHKNVPKKMINPFLKEEDVSDYESEEDYQREEYQEPQTVSENHFRNKRLDQSFLQRQKNRERNEIDSYALQGDFDSPDEYQPVQKGAKRRFFIPKTRTVPEEGNNHIMKEERKPKKKKKKVIKKKKAKSRLFDYEGGHGINQNRKKYDHRSLKARIIEARKRKALKRLTRKPFETEKERIKREKMFDEDVEAEEIIEDLYEDNRNQKETKPIGPPFCNYGYKNVNPIVPNNFMKTFNANPKKTSQKHKYIMPRREKTVSYQEWKKFLNYPTQKSPKKIRNTKNRTKKKKTKSKTFNFSQYYEDPIPKEVTRKVTEVEHPFEPIKKNFHKNKVVYEQKAIPEHRFDSVRFEEPEKNFQSQKRLYRTRVRNAPVYHEERPLSHISKRENESIGERIQESRGENMEMYQQQFRIPTRKRKQKYFRFVPKDPGHNKLNNPKYYKNKPQYMTAFIKAAGV